MTSDDLRKSKTYSNVLTALANESMSRNDYLIYARQAEREGHPEAASLFEQMAENERQHAKLWFRFIHDDNNDTLDNLLAAAKKENSEWKDMYPSFAKTAREEGFGVLAEFFDKIASIENDHEKKFNEMYLRLIADKEASEKAMHETLNEAVITGTGSPFSPDSTGQPQEPPANNVYRCILCGSIEESPGDICPICGAIYSYI